MRSFLVFISLFEVAVYLATAQKTTCKEIRCFSHGHRYETCYLPDITIVDVRVKKLHSKHAGCVRAYGQPQTDYNEKNKGIWGVSDENFIWVAGGCKADFEYCYQVCECSASGDPHFELFDGQKMSYQGICKYLFAEAHSGDCFISVDVMTAQSIRHPNAAYVEAIYVTIGEANESVSIGQNKEIKVNDVLETAPYTGDGYTISEAGDFIVVENICDMKAMHNGKNKAKVIINKEDGISFTGVCGNCNGVPDDLRLKNGTDVSHEAHRAIMIGNSYAYQPETCKCNICKSS